MDSLPLDGREPSEPRLTDPDLADAAPLAAPDERALEGAPPEEREEREVCGAAAPEEDVVVARAASEDGAFFDFEVLPSRCLACGA